MYTKGAYLLGALLIGSWVRSLSLRWEIAHDVAALVNNFADWIPLTSEHLFRVTSTMIPEAISQTGPRNCGIFPVGAANK